MEHNKCTKNHWQFYILYFSYNTGQFCNFTRCNTTSVTYSSEDKVQMQIIIHEFKKHKAGLSNLHDHTYSLDLTK